MPRRKRQRGKRGQGSVYYDETLGTWMAALTIGYVDGKRRTAKRRAHDEDDAERLLEGLRRAHAAGVDPAKGTLGQFLNTWLENRRGTIRESTWISYQGHVRLHISPLLGGIPLVRLQPSDVRRLIRDRTAAGLSPATVGRIVTTLRIAVRQAVSDRILLDDPTSGVRLPRVEREPVRPLTQEGAEAIIAATAGSDVEELVRLLLGSGLRVGEALGLDWGDVREGFVVVRRSKTQVRAVPVSDDAVEALGVLRQERKVIGDAEPVFLGSRTGKRMRADVAYHVFDDCLKAAKMEPMRLHDLRHGVATMLVAQGVHMRVIAEQLGHRNPALTARVYAHVVPESQREAVRLLSRHRGTG